MPAFTPLHQLAAILFLLLPSFVSGIVISFPVRSTIFDQSPAAQNYIQWQLFPLTYPVPSSSLFDLYLRNGIGEMYTPFLNVKIAENIDALRQENYLTFANASQYVPGPGYQLFMTAPGDPNTAYCDSEVFAIGTQNFNPASRTYVAPQSAATPTSSPSSSSVASSATTSSPPTSQDAVATSQTVTEPSSSSPPLATGTLQAASIPGGMNDQGRALLSGTTSGTMKQVAVARLAALALTAVTACLAL